MAAVTARPSRPLSGSSSDWTSKNGSVDAFMVAATCYTELFWFENGRRDEKSEVDGRPMGNDDSLIH